jgi:nitrite reductase (NADH) large subunit
MDVDEKPLFPSLPDTKPIIPIFVWRLAELISIICFFAVVYILYTQPKLGLFLFWGAIIPCAPMIFFLFLGLWRNICPMAAIHQIPRIFKFSLEKEPPKLLREYGYVISLLLIASIIPMRKVVLNEDAFMLAVVMLALVTVAFINGFLFKGKSGWCTSICPVLPFERVYGQMPFLWVRNGYCEPCIGCTQKCYDFNPYTSSISILTGKNHRAAGFRKFFIAALPGFILAFYLVPSPPEISMLLMYEEFLAYLAGSIAIFYALVIFTALTEAEVTFLYGISAFNIFYWFTFKVVAQQFENYLGWVAPQFTTEIASAVVFILSLLWIYRVVINEQKFMNSEHYEGGVGMLEDRKVIAKGPKPLNKSNLFPQGKVSITVLPEDIAFHGDHNKLLLTILEENKIPIQAGCHMGMCGSDPVLIIEGMENLSDPSQHEKDTLKRLGNSNRVRLSCSARVRGDITISLDKEFDQGQEGAEDQAAESVSETKIQPSVKKVVVVGNGISGMTAAEHIHQLHPDCHVTVVAREGYQLYNRMAIASLIYGRNSIDSLFLSPKDKPDSPNEEIYYNTLVNKIERDNRQIVLASGENLAYDKLILAMGSEGFVPAIENFGVPGTFVLRDAEDAMKIRQYIQENATKQAVVAGGGLLGLEAAYALHKMNQEVCVVEFAERLLPRQLDLIGSSFLLQYLQSLGMKVMTKAVTDKLKITDHVTGVYLTNGTYFDCDIFLACAGIRPNIGLAKKAGLAVNRGVKVNANMQTSDADIYAVGDLAEYDGRVEGLWMSGINQARVAAENALGKPMQYEGTVSHTILKVAGINLASIGQFEPSDESDIVISLMDVHEYHYRKLVISDNKIKGAILIGFPEEAALIANVITSGLNVQPLLSDLMKGDWTVLRDL